MLTKTFPAQIGVMLICFALFVAPTVDAQKKEAKGRIKGMVSDGAAGIGGSKVTFESADAKFAATTDAKGLFEIELPAGMYQIAAEKETGSGSVKLSKIRIKPDRFTMLRIQLKGADASCSAGEPSPEPKDKNAGKQHKP